MPEDYPELNTVEVQAMQRELELCRIALEIQREDLLKAHAETEAALAQCADLFDSAPTGYYNLANDGTILAANLAGAKLAGAEREKVLQFHFALAPGRLGTVSRVSQKDIRRRRPGIF
jgi:PAS domain-containing protein